MERRRRLRSTGRGLTLNRTAFSFFSCFPHLFFPVISLASRTARLEPSARARRAPTHFLSSFPATTKRLREQLASLRARATGRCLRGLRSSKCIQSPLPDSTHASASFGISSLRTSSPRTTFGRALLFRAHALSLRLSASAPLCSLPAHKNQGSQSPMPRLHFVTLGIGCP